MHENDPPLRIFAKCMETRLFTKHLKMNTLGATTEHGTRRAIGHAVSKQSHIHTMKSLLLILPFALFSIAALPSCKEKGPAEKIGEKIDDATDSRPAEGIRDAIEDATKK